VADGKGYPRGWNQSRVRTVQLTSGASVEVSLTSTSQDAVPSEHPKEPAEALGFWAVSTFLFVVKPKRLAGRFRFEVPNEIREASITQFGIESTDNPHSTASVTEILNPELTSRLSDAAKFLSAMKGRWTPPGRTIFIKDGKPQRAPAQGWFVPLRSDYRKPRVGERHWEDTDEIDRIVQLQHEAEQLLNPAQRRKSVSARPRSANQADIERWIAEQSGVWSPGTVHRQLQIARNQGKIQPKKRGRKKAT